MIAQKGKNNLQKVNEENILNSIKFIPNLNYEEIKEYEKIFNELNISLFNLDNSLKKLFESENKIINDINTYQNLLNEEEKQTCDSEYDDNSNEYKKYKIIKKEKIENLNKNHKEIINEVNNDKDNNEKNQTINQKYYFRRRKDENLNNNLIRKKRNRNEIKKNIIKHKSTKKEKKKIKKKKNETLKKSKNNEENINNESLINYFSFIDEKIKNKQDKKYVPSKIKMSNEERKDFIINIKNKMEKLTLKQIIQIKEKFFKYNIDNISEVNLSQLNQELLQRLNIYVDSFINDNLLQSNYIPYKEELNKEKQIKKYINNQNIESDCSIDDNNDDDYD